MLPTIENDEQYDKLDRSGPEFVQVAQEIAEKHKLSTPKPLKEGSAILFETGDAIIKMFAPLYSDLYVTEVGSLEYLLPVKEVPTPEIVALGDFEGWPYLVMTKLPGKLLSDLWPELSEDEKRVAVSRCGRLLKTLHELENPGTGVSEPDWERFLEGQVDGCFERQSKSHLDPHWMEQIPDFLSSVELKFEESCFLHTEIGRNHIFVDDSLKITGLFDFEPAMVGDPEYDLASVGIFLTSGESGLFQKFLENYRPELLKDGELSRRAMAYTILHRYSNLRWYIEMLPKGETLDELSRLWWTV